MKLAIIAITGFLLLACADSREVKLERFLLRGNLAMDEHNHQDAIRFYSEALNIDPCYPYALNNMGTVLHKDLKSAEAIEKYSKAIACHPDFLPAYFNRANTYYDLKEYYSALRDVEKIKSVKPDTALVWFLDGLINSKLHDFKRAVTSFDRAMKIDSTNAEYLINRGTAFYYLGQYDEAEKDLRQAAIRAPKEPNIFNTLGLIAAARQNIPLAMTMMEKALQLSPDHPWFLNNRGYLYLLQGKLQLALEDINQSILLDPANGWAYRNKGIFWLMSDRPDEALPLLKRAEELDSFVEKVHFYLGMAYRKLGDKKEACRQFALSNRNSDNMVTPDLIKECR